MTPEQIKPIFRAEWVSIAPKFVQAAPGHIIRQDRQSASPGWEQPERFSKALCAAFKSLR
ncbi:MAG: hypothetical protein ABI700_01735 [Chloroflexota bacterium]